MSADRKTEAASAPTWTKLDDRLLQKTRVFDLRAKRMRSPDGAYEDDFFYVESRDWVNILPVTTDGQLVMVKQFRFGVHAPTLETPGGLVEKNDPFDTAVRELEEETGYVAREMISLGSVHPNPAMLTNRCHVFLALDAVKEKPLNLEPSEDITVHLFPLRDVPKMIQDGEISHAIVAAALFLLWAKRPELLK